MLIAGLWHGAAWTFVIFGFLHGAALVTNNVWRKTKKKVPPLLAQALTVAFVVCTFVVFRSSGLAQAGTYLGWMVGVGHGRSPAWPVVPTPMLLLSILCAIPLTVSRPRMKEFVPSMGWAAACAGTIVVSCLLLNSGGVKDFIYRGF
jgi:D-alanyl-lipoteichoic acid acyltransferase DltB (MBOAT superfamily)